MIVVSIKKQKAWNKNVVESISHEEYKDILVNKKCLRHLINRVQSENYKIWAYEINTISLSCFDDEIYILNNGYDRLALGY